MSPEEATEKVLSGFQQLLAESMAKELDSMSQVEQWYEDEQFRNGYQIALHGLARRWGINPSDITGLTPLNQLSR